MGGLKLLANLVSFLRRDKPRVERTANGNMDNRVCNDRELETEALDEDDEPWSEGEMVVEVPINGELDLHNFNPKEVKDLVTEYLLACHEKGIFQVRVVHGKGKGVLRKRVHALLKKHPLVLSYHLAEPFAGGWGATLVTLSEEPKVQDERAL